eukprot:350954-Chlamydomonas_euryale.AAC.3
MAEGPRALAGRPAPARTLQPTCRRATRRCQQTSGASTEATSRAAAASCIEFLCGAAHEAARRARGTALTPSPVRIPISPLARLPLAPSPLFNPRRLAASKLTRAAPTRSTRRVSTPRVGEISLLGVNKRSLGVLGRGALVASAPFFPVAMADKAALHLDERWDKLLDLSLRRLTYGTLAGGAAAMLLFSE